MPAATQFEPTPSGAASKRATPTEINFTFRLRAGFAGDPRALFRDVYDAQRGPWAAYLDLGRHVICSASPELFFTTGGGSVACEPMKGTAPRGRYGAEDRQLALGLRRSEKNRAENVPVKVRLLLGRDGSCRAGATPLPPDGDERPARAALARRPVYPAEPWLYHKTTRRQTYDAARAERPDCDEVILWNPAGEVTEGTITNVVVDIGGRRVTPPVSAGLLAGTFRAQLLASGAVAERPVRIAELREAGRIWIVNSVRGWREALLVD